MKIPYVNLKKQWKKERLDLLKIIDKVLLNDNWVNGNEINKFENNIKKICKTKYCIALNSGTDALTLGMHVLGVKRGDEVITTSNSFVASTATIIHLGATPVFVDVLDNQCVDHNKIEQAITKKTKAIMIIHLGGRMPEMDKILKISKKYQIPIIEDAAQSIGSMYKGKPSGSFGEVSCFSAHPLKNLNAVGDAGYICTNNKTIYQKIHRLRNHGQINRNVVESFGYVSRMDTIQAAILNYRLKNLKSIVNQRQINAKIYQKHLNQKHIYFTKDPKYIYNTYHTFVIQVKERDKLQKYLERHRIQTSIHYPVPIHLLTASKKNNIKFINLNTTTSQSKRILTLPINQFLKEQEIVYICNLINKFYEK